MFRRQSSTDGDLFALTMKPVNDGLAFLAPEPTQTYETREWDTQQEEGQLSVDVIDAGKELRILAPMAGAIAERLEVYIHHDLLTIRGVRQSPVEFDPGDASVYSECFWGPFSRTIVLPVEVYGDQARAEFKHGVLVVRVPKRQSDTSVPITIVDE